MNILVYSFALILSGAISGMAWVRFMNFGMYIIPGIFFGIVLGLNYYLLKKIKVSQILTFVVFSCLGWFAAFILGIMTISLAIVVSGMMGAAIVAFGVRDSLKAKFPIYPAIIVGGICGWIFKYLFFQGLSNDLSLIYKLIYTASSFAIWQLAVGVTIKLISEKYTDPAVVLSEASTSSQNMSLANRAIDKSMLYILIAICVIILIGFIYVVKLCGEGGGC